MVIDKLNKTELKAFNQATEWGYASKLTRQACIQRCQISSIRVNNGGATDVVLDRVRIALVELGYLKNTNGKYDELLERKEELFNNKNGK